MFDPALNEHESRLDRLQLAALCGLMLLGAACSSIARRWSATQPAWRLVQPELVPTDVWYVLTGAAAALCWWITTRSPAGR